MTPRSAASSGSASGVAPRRGAPTGLSVADAERARRSRPVHPWTPARRAAGGWRAIAWSRSLRRRARPGRGGGEGVRRGDPIGLAGTPTLGIVRAGRSGSTVSRASELPDRRRLGPLAPRFGAARSVAVPLLAHEGSVRAVVSVALGDGPIDPRLVIGRIRSGAAGVDRNPRAGKAGRGRRCAVASPPARGDAFRPAVPS